MLAQPQPDATALLRQEHQWILKVADVLELLAQSVQDGGEPDLDSFGECIRFTSTGSVGSTPPLWPRRSTGPDKVTETRVSVSSTPPQGTCSSCGTTS